MKKFTMLIILSLLLVFPYSGAISQDSTMAPPDIKFLSPANGSVLPPETESVTVKGVILGGSRNISSIDFHGEDVYFNIETLEFTHTFPVDTSKKYQTFYFNVKDNEFSMKSVPFCLTFGDKHTIGQPSVVNNAIRIAQTGYMNGFLDEALGELSKLVNIWKADLIYGWNGSDYSSYDENSPLKEVPPLLPIVYEDDVPGTLIINHDEFPGEASQGLLNLGNIYIFLSPHPDGRISVNLEITPKIDVMPGGSAKAIYVQGYHEYGVTIFGKKIAKRKSFNVSGDKIQINGGKVVVGLNDENMVHAKVDFSNGDLIIDGLNIGYGDGNVPGFLENIVNNIVKDSITKMNFEIPAFDTKDLIIPIQGVNVAAWPMMNSIFTINNGDLIIDLGMQASLDPNIEAVDPSLDHFLATNSEVLPELSQRDEENFVIAISDDMANQLAYVIYQSGFINKLEITEMVKQEGGQVVNEDLEASVKLGVPTINNFSQTANNLDVGKFIVRNVQLDLKNYKVLDANINAIIGLEGEFAIKVELSEDGTLLMADIDFDNSIYDIKVLYCNIPNSDEIQNSLLELGESLIRNVVSKIAGETIKLEVSTIELYGSKFNILLKGSEVVDGNLVARLKVEFLD